MKKRIIIVILAYILMCLLPISCNNANIDNNIPIKITNPTKEYLKYSDFVDSISYIQLHGIKEEPIADIKTIKFIDSLLVVFDDASQKVMLFDTDGKFLRKIGSRGMGHGEYVNCRQIDIDQYKRNVLIYDIVRGSVLRYDFEGNYLERDSLGRADDIVYVGNGNYLLTNYNEDAEERSGIFLVSATPFNRTKIRGCRDIVPRSLSCEFFDCDNSISIMTRSYEDEVLEWDNDSLISIVGFDIKENPTKRQIEEMKEKPERGMRYTYRTSFFNYRDWVFIDYVYKEDFNKDESRCVIYDKNNHNFEIVKGIFNDIDEVNGKKLPISYYNSIVSVVEDDEDSLPKIQFLHLRTH